MPLALPLPGGSVNLETGAIRTEIPLVLLTLFTYIPRTYEQKSFHLFIRISG
jgi:hypothetical protein